MGFDQKVHEIIRINTHIRDFWADGGWAPRDAAQILSRSRLDWQVSLSHTLRLWLEPCKPDEAGGRLILGWANLGALVEGTLKWFLCVYEANYAAQAIKTKRGRAVGQPLDPDEPALGELIQFFQEHVWTPDQAQSWTPWLNHVRVRRNAIHAYQDRELGTCPELTDAIGRYRALLLELEGSVPYPDEYAYPADIAAMRSGERFESPESAITSPRRGGGR
jgi:hypothetical protein